MLPRMVATRETLGADLSIKAPGPSDLYGLKLDRIQFGEAVRRLAGAPCGQLYFYYGFDTPIMMLQ